MSDLHYKTLWVDYLRSFIIVLVIFHHSSLAYTTFARFDSDVYINSTHVIVDTHRWVGLDIFQNFNDVFFMSLMFLIAGFFLISSLTKKGSAIFVRDRFYRLFVPFILGGTLLMLLAYYPAYYLASGDANVWLYIKNYFTAQNWPVGPPWFIWMLFLFNLVFAFIYPFIKKIITDVDAIISKSIEANLWWLVGLFLCTWLLYVPLAHSVGAGTWVGAGPFDFQLSRILLYFGYFLIGTMIGGSGSFTTIFSNESKLVKKWPIWTVLAFAVYIFLTVVPPHLIQLMDDGKILEFNAWMIYYTIYVLSCVFSCIAFLTFFRSIFGTRHRLWDSLSKNAYLIYMIHFVFVIWLQFILLSFDLPASVKFIIVSILSLALSWTTSIYLRKIPLINKYI